MQRHSCPLNLNELKIEVTYRCNLNCIHCSSDARPSNLLEMSRDDCLRILAESADMGAQEVAFSGGEPFLWPHISDVVEAAVQYGLKVTLYTSGCTNDFQETAERLHTLGAFRLIFSVFGSSASSHERMTRKAGSFESTKSAMKYASFHGLKTELHFVPMSNNYKELTGVAQLACKLGATRVSVLRLVPQGRATLVRDRVLTRVQNLELRYQIQALRTKHGHDFVRTGSPYNFLMVNDSPACFAAFDRLVIGPDLRLYPCDAFKQIGAKEIVETEAFSCLTDKGLSDCWHKSPYLGTVRTHLTTDLEEPCVSCKLLEECASGCLAQKVIAYGSLVKRPDPDCLAVGQNFLGDSA